MHPVGLAVVVAVLIVGTAVGLWRRRSDGRFRPVGQPIPSAGSASSVSPEAPVGPVSSTDPGKRTSPVIPDAEEGPGVIVGGGQADDPSAAGEWLDAGLLASLGVQTGPVTLLQFSSAFCAPCRAVRRVSSEVADMLPGVQHVEVDAESHLDAVRALGIWRTPTLLVLDADGRVVKRATGVPAKAQIIAVLGELLPAA